MILCIKMHLLKDREEWLEHRKKYIGGSECSAIIGQNPYMSNVELFKIKTGRKEQEDISNKPYVQYGIAAEPLIREIFKLNYPNYEVFYEENNSFVNDKYPFAAASLDGWIIEKETGRHGIWECKTTEIMSSVQKDKWQDKIPMNYFCQLLHYFLVREDCEFAHLTALLTWKIPGEEVYQQMRNYHIERAEILEDIEYLKDEEAKFFENLKNGTMPALILPQI